MPHSTHPTPGPLLDPVERRLEVLFGLIMVLSFTGSLSVATAAREDVREMLIGALGCNLAWGIVDGVMYMMARLLDRGREFSMLRAARGPNAEQGRAAIAEALPSAVVSALPSEDLELVRGRLARLPEPPLRPRPTWEDFRGAVMVFFLVFLSTFPVALPFVFVSEVRLALRLSNAVAILLLFISGVSLGRHSSLQPLRTGLVMVAIGVALVAITIALGG
jgi:hypothetical protein